MTWNRTAAAKAVAAAIEAQTTVTVLARPPQTLNPPVIVVGRPDQVRYAEFAFGVDDVDLPVICVGAADGEDMVDQLVGLVRESFADPTLGGQLVSCVAAMERNWRNVTVGGVDLLQAEVLLAIRM
jgi:hypothetical protein